MDEEGRTRTRTKRKEHEHVELVATAEVATVGGWAEIAML